MSAFEPYGSAAGTMIDRLEIETDEDVLVLHGSIEIGRDKEGLSRLKRLSDIVQRALARLESEELPELLPPSPEGPTGPNPFEE